VLAPGTLPELLETVASGHAGRIAIAGAGRQLTYRRLHDAVVALAGRLGELGVERGTRVALLVPNGGEFVASFFAVARRGGVVLPLNDRYRDTELTHCLADARPSLLVTVPPLEAVCRRVIAAVESGCRLLVLDGARGPAPSGPPGSASRRSPAASIEPDDPVLSQYSSGSTGAPRRVVRTHANLTFELSRLGELLALGPDDRVLGVVPFSHVNGLVRSMLAALSVGASLAPLAAFRRHELAATIERERITVVVAVPFVFRILADTVFPRPVDLSSLRLCVSASAPLPEATNRRFHARHGLFVRQLYGSTETGTISVNAAAEVEDSLDSVGRPLPGVAVRILRDDGSEAGVDEAGEVAVESPAAFRGGSLLTGDLGRIDARGYLRLVGRRTFFINRGGYKVNPWELETLLQAHPKVDDVAVVGVPAASGDEVVKAVIAPREPCSAEEIVEYCRGRIADFKVPSVVEFRPRLPRGPTGKILRRELA
jgi:long-chain acyl-CoA synthetase